MFSLTHAVARLQESLQIQSFRMRQMLRWLVVVRFRETMGRLCIYGGLLLFSLSKRHMGLALLLRGRRGMERTLWDSLIWKRIQSDVIRDLVPDHGMSLEELVSRVIILKLPRAQGSKPIERGVLLVKFGITLRQLHHLLDKNLLRRWFTLVIEPSWVGVATPEILCWQGTEEFPTVVFAPFESDEKFIANGPSGWRSCTLGSGDWVDEAVFHVEPDVQKCYDSIYVANFAPYKRIDRFLEAGACLSERYPGYRAALVCAGHGQGSSDATAAQAMIRRAERGGWLSYFKGVDRPTLNRLFNRSKVNVLLSSKEGANRALCEGLMAGVPAVLIQENMGINRRHINAQTGAVVPDVELEETLLWFREHYAELSPHAWAIANIAPRVSTTALEQVIRETELQAGRAWTEGLMVKVNDPELRYQNESNQWLRSATPDLLRCLTGGSTDEAVVAMLESLHLRRSLITSADRCAS